jgi:hypothetical protein
MIPHRAKLALAAAACCALASCLDARVNVHVSVIPIDKDQKAETMKRLKLTVYKAASPFDDDHPQYARCSGETVEPQTTDMEGKATFSLLPGDYEVCTEEQLYKDEKFKWSVPFRVAQEGLRVPQLIEDEMTYVGCGRVEQRVRALRWKYTADSGGTTNELLLTSDNSLDRTHTPTPLPTPSACSSPTPSPTPSASPGAQTSPTTQSSPTAQASPATTPATTASPVSTASPTTAASPAVSPTPATGTQPAPARATVGARRRNRGF